MMCLLLLRGTQRADANVADGAGGVPGGEPERAARDALDARGNLASLGIQIDDSLGVDPCLDALRSDADAEAVPAVRVEPLFEAGVIFGSVHAIDARQAHDATAPAADNERAERIADWEGGRAEEIVAGELLAFESDFVVDLGEVGAGVGDTGHRVAFFHHDDAILAVHLACD